MDVTTMAFILLLWIGGLGIAYKFAEIGYPWLAFFVLFIVGCIRIRWGDEKDEEKDEAEQ